MNARFIRPAGLAAAAMASIALSLWLGPRIAGGVAAAASWLRSFGALGCLVFVALEFLVTLVGIVPGALLGIAAGAIYGVMTGFWASAGGIMAGAVVAFGLSRSMLRPWIGRVLGKRTRLAMLDQAIAKEGWRIVALLRISPAMPFSITSYALGFSGISARDYVLGTLASLPPLLGYVVIGALGGIGYSAKTRAGTEIHLTLLVLGVAATLALTVYLSRLLGGVLRAGQALAPKNS
jgi:uncharacterized membrane protein YdjX (TVP38/TMEM64 family)